MKITELKEKLENNCCHIHNERPLMTILETGTLDIKTCCLLFERQLHLLVDQQDEKYLNTLSR